MGKKTKKNASASTAAAASTAHKSAPPQDTNPKKTRTWNSKISYGKVLPLGMLALLLVLGIASKTKLLHGPSSSSGEGSSFGKDIGVSAADVKDVQPSQTPNSNGLDVMEENGRYLRIYRNGEGDSCAMSKSVVVSDKLEMVTSEMFGDQVTLKDLNKYQLDAVLTYFIASVVLDDDDEACGIPENPSPSPREQSFYKSWKAEMSARPLRNDFLKFCDMGEGSRMTIQTDHSKVVKVPAGFAGRVDAPDVTSFPCHFHTREGLRITSGEKLLQILEGRETRSRNVIERTSCANVDGECVASDDIGIGTLDLYAVQAGRVFMFAPKFVGEIFELDHITPLLGNKVYLETISLEPRVFDIHNFFSGDEADKIVRNAINQKADSHKFKRSSTGSSGYNINPTRTSENAFDTHSKEAQTIKRRCLSTLGFDVYEEGVTDGLQVLRYNQTMAYIDHMDWIDDLSKKEEHNYDSMRLGSNRFATILLYFTDINEEAGGQTVFTKALPLGVEKEVPFHEAIQNVRNSGIASLFQSKSWEEKLVAQCETKLAVRPHRARAVLFYSQYPDGQPDPSSKHGACPVLNEQTKIAANLWVWNAPRPGFNGSPVNDWVKEKGGNTSSSNNKQLKAVFENSGAKYGDAKLYFQESFFADLKKGKPVSVNTYEGHDWNVKVNDKIVQKWTVSNHPFQKFTL